MIILSMESLMNILEHLLAVSQSDVIIYNIKGDNGLPPDQIIDTPGFGDTLGIKQDKIITGKIKIERTLKEKLYSLNAIYFVAQSSNARLTDNQKFIFTSKLDLFGLDVKENFIAMLTFCDGGVPQVISSLKDPDCIFSNVFQHIKNLDILNLIIQLF